MIVIDASALIDAFLSYEPIVALIEEHDLHTPVTVDAEVLHGIRRALLRGAITDVQAESVITSFRKTPLMRHPVQPLVPRVWSLRRNITAYDASYVALAESLDLPLITRDARLARSSGHAARIEYID
jgi:predicted nucleic acid-binding protein